MSKKTRALESMAEAIEALQQPDEPMDIAFTTAQSVVVVAGVTALVVIAGVGLRLAWLFTHLDSDPAIADAFEGGGNGRDTRTYKASSSPEPSKSSGNRNSSLDDGVGFRGGVPACVSDERDLFPELDSVE